MVSSIAASGIQSGFARFNASIANAGAGGDTVKAVTEQIAAKSDIQATIAVLQTAYDMERTFERYA